MTRPVEFGVFLPTERECFEGLLSDARICEGLGYHSVWISDHLIGMYRDPSGPRLECWTTVSALAGATSRIRLGQLVLCNPFRHPPLLAKMGATLDVISGGRLVLGLGTGWHEPEFRAYGYPFEGPAARVGRVGEVAQIIKRMWTEDSPSFRGRYYEIEGAYCSPKPVQEPHPPVMIGGGGEKLLLGVVARHADVCNFAAWRGTPEDYMRKLGVLERHCERVGRDPEEIRKSWAAYVLIGEDQERWEMSLRQFTERMAARYPSPTGSLRPPIAGTPEDCIEQIQRYVDLGVTLFILRFMGEDLPSEARLFAEEVVRAFK